METCQEAFDYYKVMHEALKLDKPVVSGDV